MKLNPVQEAMMALVYASKEAAMRLSSVAIPTTDSEHSFSVQQKRDLFTIKINTPMRLGKSIFLGKFVIDEAIRIREEGSSDKILFLGSQPSIGSYEFEGSEILKTSSTSGPLHGLIDFKYVSSGSDYGRVCSMNLIDVVNLPQYRWVIFEDFSWLCGKDIHAEKLIEAYKSRKADQFFLLVG